MAFDISTILLQAYRLPAITAYNRLEPRPRDTKFDRSLKAEVRDAIWMLGRQWQTGEFTADDAGSAAKVKLLTNKYFIDKIALGKNLPSEYDASVPIETRVEREKVPVTLQLRIEMGNYLARLLKITYSGYLILFLSKYKLVNTIQAEDVKKIEEEKESFQLYELLKRRNIDGYQVYTDIQSGSYHTWINSEATINITHKTGLIALGVEFKEWYNSLFSQPVDADDSAWDNSRLEYQFKVTARQSSETSIALSADQYYTGELDWYAFNFGVKKDSLDTTYKANEEVISFMPAPVAFKGMPNARYWEMEERQTNFGALNASTTGLLHMLLAEFGLIYSNDWMVIPYQMPVNTICKIIGIVVTDVFGDRTIINPVAGGPDSAWQKWAMYNMSGKFQTWPVNNYLFLPPTLTKYLESEPLEKVNFIRDEMANMVWAVEEVVPTQLGKGIRGKEQALVTDEKEEEDFSSSASIRYILGTKVPSNWIPFIPVHKSGSVKEVQFQRAQMPEFGTTGSSTASEFKTIKPRGTILTEVKEKYFIQEEEIPKSGIIVKRTYQRTRWLNGKTYLWLGRRKETGRGQGYSGLMFDQIEDVKKKEE